MPLSVITPPDPPKTTTSYARLSIRYRDAMLANGHMTMGEMAAAQQRAESPAYAFRDRGKYGLERR